MKYTGRSSFEHTEKARIGVLITNLGTPDAPTTPALRRYLKEFLSDPRVVEVPRLLWWFILRVILLIRPAKSAKSYASIWTEQGSPLAIHTKAQAEGLQAALGDKYIVRWAMRYGQPAISETIDTMLETGVRKLLVLPLYPQYSASTGASTFDALAKDFAKRRWLPGLRFVEGYHDHPAYIDAVAKSIENYWEKHGRAEKLLFTFHGVPLRFLHNGDPYHCFCLSTSRLVAEKLGLSEKEYLVSFQSRFGREEWLKPYTDKTLIELAQQGVKKVQLVCPGFSSDCLETLEEIEVENKQYFLQAGGETFEYIPALNSSDEHIHFLTTLANENMQGWNMPGKDTEQQSLRAKNLKYNLIDGSPE